MPRRVHHAYHRLYLPPRRRTRLHRRQVFAHGQKIVEHAELENDAHERLYLFRLGIEIEPGNAHAAGIFAQQRTKDIDSTIVSKILNLYSMLSVANSSHESILRFIKLSNCLV